MSKGIPYWEILGLEEAPKDRKTLKRAYAKRLKQTRPEDDAEGFMLLRDAHDIGLQEITYLQSLEVEQNAEDAPIRATETPAISEKKTEISSHNTEDKGEPVVIETGIEEASAPLPPAIEIESDLEIEDEGQFLVQDYHEAPKFPLQDDLTDLLEDSEKRYARDPWAAIFKRAHALDIDDFTDFENGLLGLLLERSGFYGNSDENAKPIISQSIAASIFATLNWDEAQMNHSYKSQGIAWLKQKLVKPKYPQSHDGVHVPETASNFWTENIWWIIGLLFLVLQFTRFIFNQG